MTHPASWQLQVQLLVTRWYENPSLSANGKSTGVTHQVPAAGAALYYTTRKVRVSANGQWGWNFPQVLPGWGRCVTPTILYTGLDAWWQWGMEKDALHLLPGLRALNHVNTPMGLG